MAKNNDNASDGLTGDAAARKSHVEPAPEAHERTRL